jgi:hypothetical protein
LPSEAKEIPVAFQHAAWYNRPTEKDMKESKMRVIDTSEEMLAAFHSGHFDLEKWEAYMDACVPNAKELCLEDMRECVNAGFSWEKDFMPVLDSVLWDPSGRKEAIASFHMIADQLDGKIRNVFHKTVDADLVLYLGLCNGAGWVTEIGGRTTVLLGIEKIMELDWGGPDAMTGLIVHELGHAYHSQYGTLRIETDSLPDRFLWQLFTEGTAMVFEQEVLGNKGYFHQYGSDWKEWCDRHAELIKRSFYDDLKSMTYENQRYFGDWVSFEGHGDTGYYLGTLFVRYLLQSAGFDSVIRYDIDKVKKEYENFMRAG